MKLLIKIPTRERGFSWLQYYLDNIELESTKIVLTLDNNEPTTMGFHDTERVSAIYGDSVNKIHAYNRDIDQIAFDWSVIMVGSDDMWPRVKGFDRIILEDMQTYFPDTDGCLWYDVDDQSKAHHIKSPKGSHKFLNIGVCTLPIMGRAYYNRFGYIYNSIYNSFFCDNEQTRIARRLNKIQYIENRIVSHEHPAWCAGMPNDALYTRNNDSWHTDRKTYNNRSRYGFTR